MNYAKPNRELPFKIMGAGMSMTFMCSRCNLPKPPLGSKWFSVRGTKLQVCKSCVERQAGAA